MASWKKVIVSGSAANLASLQVDNLLNGVVTGSSNGTLGIQSINGTGSIVATTNATGLVHSGSFSGSFQGVFTGPLTGTASWATNAISASWVSSSAVYGPNGLNSILSSSYALSASYAFSSTSASFALTSSLPLRGLITASVNASTITFTKGDSSTFDIVVAQGVASSTSTVTMNNTGSGLWYPTFVISGSNSQSLYVNSASFQYNATTNTLSTTASWAITASSAISSSYSFNATSASYALTASYVLQAVSASFATLAQTANTASYVATASYASNADLLDGVHLSILATTGSNTFKADQTISGSVNVTGSISLTGSLNILGSISASAFSGSHFGTSSWALNALTASYVTSSNVYGPNGSNSILSSSYSLTASYAANGGTLTNALTFGTGLSGSASTFNGSAAVTVAISGSTTLSTNSLPKWTGTGLANSNVSDNGTVVTIATSASISAGGLNVTGNSTFQNNLIVTGDLSVAGTASFTNVDNLTIRDKFILINSGSSTLADSGWVTQYNAAGSGSAFYLEAGAAGDHGTYGRFAVAYDVIGTSTALNPNEYAVTVKVSASATPPTAPTWGGATNGSGNMYINSGNGDIYIYA